MRSIIRIASVVAVSAIFVLPWHPGSAARAGGGSDQAALHVLRLKPPPKSAYHGLVSHEYPGAWGDFAPTGIDGAGDMIMFDGCCSVIRYNTLHHIWVPGVAASGGSDSAIVASPKRFVWILPGVTRSGFSRKYPVPLVTGKSLTGLSRWADIGGLAPVKGGNAWVVGWYGHDFQWSHAALEYVDARTLQHGPVIRVPDPYTPQGVNVGPDGKVWMFDPWTKCNGISCIGPRFISYDPSLRRFATYVVPRSVWPRGWRQQNNSNAQFDASKISVAPNGTVWAVIGGEWTQHCPNGGPIRVCGVRLFELQDGTIRTGWFRLNMSSRENDSLGFTAPLILDSYGNPWLCGPKGTPEVVNAVTWTVTPMSVHGGTLTEDQHHNIWYVEKKRGELYSGC